jgi:hypothetical protein
VLQGLGLKPPCSVKHKEALFALKQSVKHYSHLSLPPLTLAHFTARPLTLSLMYAAACLVFFGTPPPLRPHVSDGEFVAGGRGVAAVCRDAQVANLFHHGEGRPSQHKHKHRLDEDEIQSRHWCTHTWLTNGRHSKLHTTVVPTLVDGQPAPAVLVARAQPLVGLTVAVQVEFESKL